MSVIKTSKSDPAYTFVRDVQEQRHGGEGSEQPSRTLKTPRSDPAYLFVRGATERVTGRRYAGSNKERPKYGHPDWYANRIVLLSNLVILSSHLIRGSDSETQIEIWPFDFQVLLLVLGGIGLLITLVIWISHSQVPKKIKEDPNYKGELWFQKLTRQGPQNA